MPEKIVEHSSKQMYVEDMVKYSIIVDRRRAFPEIKDGLKPVQRKVIFDMYELGAISYKDRIKSARTVGDTMGKYHAHGDCLHFSTELYQLNGSIITIGDAYINGITSLEILCVDPNTGEIKPAIAHDIRIGQFTDCIYHIKLSNGSEIQCTSNHPILTKYNGFVKAEDIKPNTILYSKRCNMTERPKIGKNLIQDIVFDNVFGKIQPGYEKHHRDFNYYNNSPSNFDTLTSSDHVLVHQNSDQYRNIYNDGLAKGRVSMFSENGKYRTQTYLKNMTLRNLYNETQAIRRFKKFIEFMKSEGIEITEENYYANRHKAQYPALAPLPDRIIKRHPELGCNSFEDLVDVNIPTVGELYNAKVSKLIQPFTFINQSKIDAYNNRNQKLVDNSRKYRIFERFDKLLIECNDITWDLFVQRYPDVNYINQDEFYMYLETYKVENLYVVDVELEEVWNEPMFDFTVDGYENMLIPMFSPYQDAIDQTLGYQNMPLVCVHNSSIYTAMVNLANWWKTKFPLVASHGNWGTVMGDGAAAMRYTEAGLSDFCYDCIVSDLKVSKQAVDWKDNFDRSRKEPEYLPVKVPILLINGTFGIGVGMASNLPPHNITEVIAATRKLIKNPKADVVLIPDHCQPLKIMNADWKKISETGYGSYKVRGIVEFGEDKGYPVIYIKSLPDNTTTEMVTSKLLSLIEKKQLPMVKDVLDPSKETVNIQIILKKGIDPHYVEEVLYSKCGVQGTVSVNFEAVDDINPDRFSYKRYLQSFLDFRATTKFRLYCNKYREISTRCHKLDAYIKIIESGEIDNVIKMVKKQDTIDDSILQEYLIKKLDITDLQAMFILTTDVRKLSKGYLKKYKEEFKELTEKQAIYKRAITDDGTIIMNEIDQELADIAKKYGTPRICSVVDEADANNIPKGTFKIVITEKNYIRKIPDTDKVGVIRGDQPKYILRVDNAENILLFDNMGKVFKMPVSKIPITDRSGIGTDIRILSKNCTADIINVFYEPSIKKVIEGKRKHYLTVVTRWNTIKKLDMEDFLNVNLSGLQYTKLKDDDIVTGIAIVPADLDLVIYSKQKALRTTMNEIPLFKRNASGSKAMNTNDEIEGISVLYPEVDMIVVVTRNGKMNKFPMNCLSAHKRAKSGSNVIKLDNGDSICAIFGAAEKDIIKATTSEGVVEVPVSEIKLKSGIATGQKISSIKGTIVRCDLIYNQ